MSKNALSLHVQEIEKSILDLDQSLTRDWSLAADIVDITVLDNVASLTLHYKNEFNKTEGPEGH